MNKYLTLNYWMNKLGYRPTHWTDEIAEDLWSMYADVRFGEKNSATRTIYGEKVTLSVKKMKKGGD
jgi:hypothetical protein